MTIVGRYAIFDELASGGMATVHLARLRGPVGFARTVAVKRLHAHVVHDPDIALMFVDEARLAARIRHPNVAQTLDVVEDGRDVLIVMEYVHGASLSHLRRETKERTEPAIACAVAVGVLHGLHAAHEAVSESGEPLAIVHRDVSPQNILVGVDGVARVVDFGVAKARNRLRTTRDGSIRGKLAYMSPEQLEGRVSRRTDVYAIGVVLWEALTGERLFAGVDEAETMSKVLHSPVDAPSAHAPAVSAALDGIVMRALSRDPEQRYATAREMAIAIESAQVLAPTSRVGEWVEANGHLLLTRRDALVRAIEKKSSEATPATLPEVTLEPDRPSREPTVAEVRPRPTNEASGARDESSSHGRWWIAIALVATCAAVLGVWCVRQKSHAPSRTESPVVASASSDAAPQHVVARAALVASTIAPPSLRSDPSIAPPEPIVARAPRVAVSASASATASSSATPSCTPPYRIGPDGAKIWLEQCL